jgi:DNA polymerase
METDNATQEKIEELLSRLRDCSKCPKMVMSRKEVLGEKHQPILPALKRADVLFIGIAPGRAAVNIRDSITDRPFAYASGRILAQVIKELNLDAAITNFVKCNTPKDNDFPDSVPEECCKWLAEEIMIVKPRVIVALGTKAYGWCFKYGIPAKLVWHPSYVLRSPSAYQDFKLQVKEACE